jgi:multiple sugar transport system permease protein
MKKGSNVVSAIMIVIGLTFLLPLVIMFLTSFKLEKEVLDPSSIFPKHFTTSNYDKAIQSAVEAPIALWGLNSLLISCSVTLAVVMLSSMTAFAITRIRVKGGETFMNFLIGTMMIPSQLFLIPLYVILGRLHLLDTPWSLILPATAGGFGVFMISQFMRSLPPSLEEAALIDGCNLFQVYWKVTVPLCGPALATLAVFTFIASWNDYISPLVFMEKITNYTLPVGIALFQSSYSTQYGLTLATSLLATIPLLIVFIVFQKQIIESMSSSGLKD